MKSADDKPSPMLISLILAPFGLIVAFFGFWIGYTGKIQGRGGAKLTLDSPWDWLIASFFIALGGLILLTPVYYHFKQKK